MESPRRQVPQAAQAPQDVLNAGGLGTAELRPETVSMRSLTQSLTKCASTFGAVSRVLLSNRHTCTPRLPSLTKLMSRFSKAGDWRKALYIYDTLPLLGIAPDTTVTNAAIAACGRGGDWQRAMRIFDGMAPQGLVRDVVTYSSAISALSSGKEWRLALQLFVRMCEQGTSADTYAWHSMMLSFGRAGKWQLTEFIFRALCRAHPDAAGHILAATRRSGNSYGDDADALSTEDREVLATLQPYLPGDCTRASSPSSDESSRRQFPTSGLSLSPSLFGADKALTDGQGSSSPLINSESLPVWAVTDSVLSEVTGGLERLSLASLSRSQHAPPHRSMSTLALGGQGAAAAHPAPPRSSSQPTVALSAVRAPALAPERGGQSPTQAPTSGAASGELPARTWSVSFMRACCNALLTAYAHAEPPQCERSMTLLIDMIDAGGELRPDVGSMNAAVKAYANNRAPAEALHVYDQLRGLGLAPTLVTYSTLLKCAADEGMVAEVQLLWRELHSRGFTPDVACVNAYLRSLFQQNLWDDAMTAYGALLHRSSPSAPDADTLVIMMTELLARGQPQAAIDIHSTLTSLPVPPCTAGTNLLLQAHGKLGEWHLAQRVFMTAAEAQCADGEGLLLVQKQLVRALLDASEFASDVQRCTVLDLQRQALACWKLGVAVTAESLEVAAAICTLPQGAPEAQRLQADTVVDVLFIARSLNVPLSRACAARVLCVCASQDGLHHRLLRACMPAAREYNTCSSHAGALLALSAAHSDLASLRYVLDLLASAPDGSSGAADAVEAIEASSVSDRAAALESLCLAAQALWDVGQHTLALQVVTSVWAAVTHQDPSSGNGVVLAALQSAERAVMQHSAALPPSHRDLADCLVSGLLGRDLSPDAMLCTTALQLICGVEQLSAEVKATVADVVIELLQSWCSSFEDVVATHHVLLPALLELGYVRLAATSLLRALAQAAPADPGASAARRGHGAQQHPLAAVLYRTCDALLALGAVSAAIALLLDGHTFGVLSHYTPRRRLGSSSDRESPSAGTTPEPAFISRIAPAFALDVSNLAPGMTMAVVHAWLADLCGGSGLGPRLPPGDACAAVALRGRDEEHAVAHERLPFVLAALGFERVQQSLQQAGLLPAALLRVAPPAPWTLAANRLTLPLPQLAAWLAGLRASDPAFRSLLDQFAVPV